jgi:sulfate adenylyltransferase subunit 1 (EFTu-like GTPase family)
MSNINLTEYGQQALAELNFSETIASTIYKANKLLGKFILVHQKHVIARGKTLWNRRFKMNFEGLRMVYKGKTDGNSIWSWFPNEVIALIFKNWFGLESA